MNFFMSAINRFEFFNFVKNTTLLIIAWSSLSLHAEIVTVPRPNIVSVVPSYDRNMRDINVVWPNTVDIDSNFLNQFGGPVVIRLSQNKLVSGTVKNSTVTECYGSGSLAGAGLCSITGNVSTPSGLADFVSKINSEFKKVPKVNVVVWSGEKVVSLCMSIYRPGGGGFAQIPGACASAPEFLDYCKITTPSVVLDHGAVEQREVANSSAQGSLTVECSGASSGDITLVSGKDHIPLSPAGKAKIFLNDKPLGTKLNFASGVNTYTVSDKLSEITSGGIYSGSDTLVVNIY